MAAKTFIYNFPILIFYFSNNTHSEKNKDFKNKSLGEHHDNCKCSPWAKVTVPPYVDVALSYHFRPLMIIDSGEKQTTKKPTKL